jgi:trk system potassium uptake protein TrkH
MRLNLKLIINIMGLLLMLNGLFMLFAIPFSLYYEEESWKSLLLSSSIQIGLGLILRFISRGYKKDVKKREGYLIVTLGWLVMSVFGSLPYYLSGEIPTFVDAFYETISGFTTTGSTILLDVEALPKGLLFWRSMTHWIGGMGIIVLTIAILPLLGIGGMQLFVAESPGPKADKVAPRIKETAKRLWLVYVSLTLVETILLMLGGMSFFDSINHAMSTLSTGGFSTKNTSIGFYNSAYFEYVIIVFMFLGGTNYALIYYSLTGKLDKVFKNEEFRKYAIFVGGMSLVVTLAIIAAVNSPFEQAFRHALFQVVSIVTTTGLGTADFTSWAPYITVIFFILFFTGGSAGSTSGGVKMMRHVILLKNSIIELKRQLHPNAILPVRFNRVTIGEGVAYNVTAFVLIYLAIFFSGTFVMALFGLDLVSAMGSVAASVGNIGPGLGSVGPSETYAHIPDLGKLFLCFLMLLGRLEIFTVLILLTPFFWRGQ